jgi:DNA polymerase I-like protein with 3'-5' exonuclease and polymerase domains
LDHGLITSPDALRKVYLELEKHSGFVSFDCETYGQLTEWIRPKSAQYVWDYTAKLAGFSFAFNDRSYYIPIGHKGVNFPADTFKNFLRAFFALPNRLWAHNLDYDVRVIRNFVGEYLWPRAYGDTLHLTWLTGNGVRVFKNGGERELYGLKALTKHHFNHEMPTYKETVGDVKVFVEGISDEDIAQELSAYSEQLISERKQLTIDNRPKTLTKREQQRRDKFERQLIKSRTYREPQMCDLNAERVTEYACSDAIWTLQLAIRFWPQLESMGYVRQWDDIEMPILKIIRGMHDNGLLIDTDAIAKIKDTCAPVVDDLANKFFELTGASITSNMQCVNAFYHDLKLWPIEGAPRTPAGELSVAYEALMWAKHVTKDNALSQRLIAIKLEHSELSKLQTTYTDALIKQLPYVADGRIRPTFKSYGIATGRFCSSNPNAQNLPRPSKDLPDIRAAVRAAPGKLLAAIDLNQIEVVLAAYLTGDPTLSEVVMGGKSMHDLTAEHLGVERSLAKTINFGLQYGCGPKKLAMQLNIPLEKRPDKNGVIREYAPRITQDYYDKYHELYSGVSAFRERMSDFAYQNGYVETLLGRRRKLPELRKLKDLREALDKRLYKARRLMKMRELNKEERHLMQELEIQRNKAMLRLYHEERKAGNTPVQGSAADVIKLWMVAIARDWEARGYDGLFLAQVHDELVVELSQETAEAELERMASHLVGLVKIDYEIKATGKTGQNWSACK